MSFLKVISLDENNIKFTVAFLCFFLIQSCSGSQIGKKLADSFDTPQVSDSLNDLIESDKKFKSNNLDSNSSNLEDKNITVIEQESNFLKKEIASESIIKSNRNFSKIKKEKFTPKHYRIIIKLSGANPASPAEKVTNALRDAGISFEIEKVESFDLFSVQKNILKRVLNFR